MCAKSCTYLAYARWSKLELSVAIISENQRESQCVNNPSTFANTYIIGWILFISGGSLKYRANFSRGLFMSHKISAHSFPR